MLTDGNVRAAKPRPKPDKLTDASCLYLLVTPRLRVLSLERAASSGFLQLIRQVEKLSAMIDNAALSEAKQGLEAMASADFKALGESADKLVAEEAKTKRGKKRAPLQKLASSVANSAKKVNRATPGALAEFASTTASASARYLEDTGQVDCPKCKGKGHLKHVECRSCDGVGTMYCRQTWYLDQSPGTRPQIITESCNVSWVRLPSPPPS